MANRLATSARGAFAAALLGLGVCAAPASAGTAPAPIIDVTITGNTARARIEVFTAVPPLSFELDVGISFEQPANLSADCLGISASVVDYVSDVLPRLPPSVVGSLAPSPLPVLVQIAAPNACGLAFRNGADVDIHTTEIIAPASDSQLSQYRLYKAPSGGQFMDITSAVERGSVRTRGTTGGFSDFLILLDLSANSGKVDTQLAYLQNRVADPALSATARQTLGATLAQVRAAYAENDAARAIGYAQAFERQVRDLADEGIPNRWRSARDQDNVAGDMIGIAKALQFNLARL